MSVTFFAARLRCTHCGCISPDDASTFMASHLLDRDEPAIVRPGDRIGLGPAEIAASFYLLRMPPRPWPLVLLQDWLCPSCEQTQFALVVFADGAIASIEAATNPRAAVAAAHLATERLPEVYELFTREPLFVERTMRPDFLSRLQTALPIPAVRWFVL